MWIGLIGAGLTAIGGFVALFVDLRRRGKLKWGTVVLLSTFILTGTLFVLYAQYCTEVENSRLEERGLVDRLLIRFKDFPIKKLGFRYHLDTLRLKADPSVGVFCSLESGPPVGTVGDAVTVLTRGYAFFSPDSGWIAPSREYDFDLQVSDTAITLWFKPILWYGKNAKKWLGTVRDLADVRVQVAVSRHPYSTSVGLGLPPGANPVSDVDLIVASSESEITPMRLKPLYRWPDFPQDYPMFFPAPWIKDERFVGVHRGTAWESSFHVDLELMRDFVEQQVLGRREHEGIP